MVTIYSQILHLFRSLPVDERKELARHLYPDTAKTTFYETMTDGQRAHLANAIAQANRNEGDLASVVLARFRQELPTIAA